MGKESELYDPYNTKTLGGTTKLDVETYENVQNSIHLERTNRKLLELTDLIGKVTNTRSSSGPLPGTGKIEKTNFTAATQSKIVASAQAGEVWQVMGACANRVAASGTFTFVLAFTNGVDSVRIESLTGSGYNEFNITSTAGPMFIDENISLECDSSGGSFPSDVDILVALQRVR